ncbi:hypothetical protein M431DRAFT_458790 [Trichoderma harzianum CBS 226.95]|uniref:Uncharacterized protein n=1 Tax=Trichoderma harzianum CBS 226.95 TaxID=983964 RepID=A0A2T4A7X6_TRIHA|nr:hypothetical protein M431DRAFT_458790 [Trichoderma harzianum CBS 226.95]PTB53175.1 hypothetical protein M431DRAFT_458790 [Trichoderma harzianum CBS 226.95]
MGGGGAPAALSALFFSRGEGRWPDSRRLDWQGVAGCRCRCTKPWPQGFLLLGDPREEFVPCSGYLLVQDSRYRTGGGASDDAGTGGFAPQSPAFTICQVGDEWSDPCVAKVPAQYGMAHAGQGARSQVTAERVGGGSVGDCLGGLASAV